MSGHVIQDRNRTHDFYAWPESEPVLGNVLWDFSFVQPVHGWFCVIQAGRLSVLRDFYFYNRFAIGFVSFLFQQPVRGRFCQIQAGSRLILSGFAGHVKSLEILRDWTHHARGGVGGLCLLFLRFVPILWVFNWFFYSIILCLDRIAQKMTQPAILFRRI